MSDNEYEILVYSDDKGREPFTEWLTNLKNKKSQQVILLRIQRIRRGNFGDCKKLKCADGIEELRVQYGPGFRIYFSRIENRVVLLLGAGDKKSQEGDIEKVKKFLKEFRGVDG